MKENNEINENTKWEEILKLIKMNQFSDLYKEYELKFKEKGYLISKGKENIFLFNKK